MKTKPHELLIWILVPILTSCLLAWFAMPAYSKNAEQKVSTHAPASAPQVTTTQEKATADAQEVRKLIDELQAREREDYTLVLEGQRKTMDWWFGFLAIVTAVLAVFGALIPYLMGRKDRELIAQDKALVEQDKAEIEQMLGDAKAALDEAKATVVQIHQHKTESEKLLEDFKSDQDGKAKEIKEAVAAIQNDPASDTILRLRAEAITASQVDQADKAYTLWRALAELVPTDASAHFNTGHWAYKLGEKSQGGESIRWLKQAGQHYSQALCIKPDMNEAANNLGAALAAEAQIIAASDLDTARKLWQQAGEKYQQALNIKPSKHEAASNWGLALAAEAQVIATIDLDTARKLWQQAGEKYQQALSIKPDYHEAANNLGVALSAEAQAITAIDLDTARKLWQQAGEKYRQALGIKPSYYEAAFNWGLSLAAEAQVIATIDLDTARKLWQQAGEKYRQALGIKPNYHEVANSFGAALATEARVIAANDPDTARKLWQQAGEQYQQAFSIKPDKYEAVYNWGTALANEAQVIATSDPNTARKLWQQAGEKYQQALGIKPDYHEAINNYGSALLHEANSLAHTNIAQALLLRDHAERLLLQHAKTAPDKVAYNLACAYGLRGDVALCLYWLRTCQIHDTLPDYDHLKNDSDLDAVRTAPEFVEWMRTICPQDQK